MIDPSRIEQRLTELQQQLAAIPTLGARPLSTTRDESDAMDRARAELEQRIRGLRHTSARLSEFADIAEDERWLAFENTWRPALVEALVQIKSPIRDRELKLLADNLMLSIALIDRGLNVSRFAAVVDLTPTRLGQLMLQAGYAVNGDALRGPEGFRGSITQVERRLTARKQECANALAELEDLLLDDAARAAREAKHNQHRAALRTMRVQHDETGTSLVAYTHDGDPLPLSEMTPEQQAAFAWFAEVAG
jgi:hypothetical protein